MRATFRPSPTSSALLILFVLALGGCLNPAVEPLSEQETAAAPLPGNPRVVEANGARFHYVERGTGEPMVLVHGTLQDYTSWLPHVEVFDDRYRVIAYSRRHNWPNDNGEAPKDFSARYGARDLAALIESLDLGPVHLVGFSYGALTSLILSVQRPDLVRTLVLAEPPVNPESLGLPATPWGEHTRLYADHVRRGEVRAGMELFAADVLGPERAQGIPESVWQQLMLNAKEFRAVVTSTDPYPPVTAADLETIAMPTLLILGQANVASAFERSGDALVGHIRGAESVTIPGASHAMWDERGDLVRPAVLEFLARWAAPDEDETDG